MMSMLVEIKNTNIPLKYRFNHVAFVSDADLAEQVKLDARSITYNHDCVRINLTIISRGALSMQVRVKNWKDPESKE